MAVAAFTRQIKTGLFLHVQPVALHDIYPDTMSPDNSKNFRNALGHFASGVAIVTAADGDKEQDPVGVTISSFNSVSLNPPLVLFSLDRSTNSLPVFEKAEGYAINILEHSAEDLCMRFAQPLSDKWQNLEYGTGYADAPLLPQSIVQFECKPYAQYDGGDHIIFVAEVIRFRVDDGYPLVFYKGKFQELKDWHEPKDEDIWPLDIKS